MQSGIDTRNILHNKNPRQLRLIHVRHDLLHELISDDLHPIFRRNGFEDRSCSKCRGETPTLTNQLLYQPLKKWIRDGNIRLTLEAYRKYTNTQWNVSSARLKSAILDIIYRCRFDEYPTSWDYTCRRLESYIRSTDLVYQQETYLPELSTEELLDISNQLQEELKTLINWEPITRTLSSQSTTTVLYEDTPLRNKSTRGNVFFESASTQSLTSSTTADWNAFAENANRDTTTNTATLFSRQVEEIVRAVSQSSNSPCRSSMSIESSVYYSNDEGNPNLPAPIPNRKYPTMIAQLERETEGTDNAVLDLNLSLDEGLEQAEKRFDSSFKQIIDNLRSFDDRLTTAKFSLRKGDKETASSDENEVTSLLGTEIPAQNKDKGKIQTSVRH